MKNRIHERNDRGIKEHGYLKSFSYLLNPEDNGGESAYLSVDVFDNGDSEHGLPSGIFTNVTLNTMCYGASSSSITLNSVGLEDIAEAVKALQEKVSQCQLSQSNLAK